MDSRKRYVKVFNSLGIVVIVTLSFGPAGILLSGNTGNEARVKLRSIYNPSVREQISLCGSWDFKYEGDAAWGKIEVPKTWGWEGDSFTNYEGRARYKKEFTIPTSWNGKYIKLYFEAVNYRADIWLNGEYVGFHEGGYTPFWFDVSSKLIYGSLNEIEVLVKNLLSDLTVPDSRIGWMNYGGIHREVFLEASDKLNILSSRITTKISAASASINSILSIQNKYSEPRTFNLSVEIVDPHEGSSITGQNRELTVSSGDSLEVDFHLNISSPELWSPESPDLYLLQAAITADGLVLDSYQTTFGIREVKARSDGIYLNGEKIFIKGVNIHEFYPGMGFTENDSIRRKDVEMIRAANANMIRLSHYPQHPQLLDLADQEGLLVYEEVPAWQLGLPYSDQKIESARRQLREMVQRDFNHPSIIIWGLANEIASDTEDGEKYIRKLLEETQSLDTTRLVSYASDRHVGQVDPGFRYVDLICINEYYGVAWHGDLSDLPVTLSRIRNSYPDKPILITEFGSSSDWKPDTYLDIIQTHWSIFEQHRDYIAGGILWVFNQYIHRGNEYDTFGIVGPYRDPLPAYYFIKGLYSSEKRISVDGDSSDWIGQDILSFIDQGDDDKGDGDYIYPENPAFAEALFDLTGFHLTFDRDNMYFLLKFGEVTNDWKNAAGFSHQKVVILIDQDRIVNSGSVRSYPNVNIDPANAWEYQIIIAPTGWSSINAKVISRDGSSVPIINRGNVDQNVIEAAVPIYFIGEPSNKTWRFMVLVGSHDGNGPNNGFRDVTYSGGEWWFGGGTDTDYDPLVLDLAFTGGSEQNRQLNSYSAEAGRYATINASKLVTFGSELSVIDQIGEKTAEDFLLPGYPNPFNTTVVITYNIPRKTGVSVIVYNISGQEVKTLVKREADPGKYKVAWDGTDEKGKPVASGVYLYRLSTDDFVRTGKLVLIK